VTATTEAESPLFHYRAYSPFLGVSVGLALFIIWFVWVILLGGLSSKPSESPTAIVILIFDFALVSLSVISLSRRVWTIRFYEDTFAVRAKNLNKEFSYSQVKDLSTFRVMSGFQNRDIISIEVDGESSFTISGNPKSRILNIDLYHWLLTKVPTTPAGPARG